METSRIHADIQVLVKPEVERNPTLALVSEKLLEKCASNANRIFLWARLMLYLIKAPSMRSVTDTESFFPSGLDAVYS